eukprot:2646218-Prymnesium_polylepis.1
MAGGAPAAMERGVLLGRFDVLPARGRIKPATDMHGVERVPSMVVSQRSMPHSRSWPPRGGAWATLRSSRQWTPRAVEQPPAAGPRAQRAPPPPPTRSVSLLRASAR